MATADECEAALHRLADRLAASESARQQARYERTLSCRIRDLDVVFTGRLTDGHLVDIARGGVAAAQVRLDVGGDDLLRLVDGSLTVVSAMASGRLRIDAGLRDLLRLRSVF